MKYTATNKPLVCMQTQSTCYKGTSTMNVKGILWHSTGANNPTLRRYVQPSEAKPAEDTYSKEKWLQILGKNQYNNDWNHIDHQAGLNCWIGRLADGSVTTVQTMPWNYRPWGCGSGNKGSCNNGWIQFEICESDLADEEYFSLIYNEACEITAYLCKLFNIDPNGYVTVNGVQVPTILCHADSAKLGFGGNHGDVDHWFPKHGKSMKTAREDVAALLKSSSAASIVKVKTYEVITPINRYSASADAIAQTNAKSDKLAPGTYYIYTKYPDGYKSVYNVTVDSTGSAPGCWINPKENVLVESQTTVNKVYRIRKSKDDAKSQVGAYANLDAAKKECQAAGEGYHVFDWDGNLVYSYTAPAQIDTQKTETQKVTSIYDLDYPEKTKIIDITISRTKTDCAKAIKKILANNKSFDIKIAKTFFELAPRYNIDPLMAISQSILETGWFKYEGSAVKPEQHNYCGLAVTSLGVTGAAFNTIAEGVTAQLQHLFAYGCADSLPANEAIVDPRFGLVARGVAPYWQQLAGRWAAGYDASKYSTPEEAMRAEATYGQKIRTLYKQLQSVVVSPDEIDAYFAEDTEDVPPVPLDDERQEGADVEKEINTETEDIESPSTNEEIAESNTSGQTPSETEQSSSTDVSVGTTTNTEDSIHGNESNNTTLPQVQSSVEESTPSESDENKAIDIDKVNFILGIIEKIIKAIFSFFIKKSN